MSCFSVLTFSYGGPLLKNNVETRQCSICSYLIFVTSNWVQKSNQNNCICLLVIHNFWTSVLKDLYCHYLNEKNLKIEHLFTVCLIVRFKTLVHRNFVPTLLDHRVGNLHFRPIRRAAKMQSLQFMSGVGHTNADHNYVSITYNVKAPS